MYIIYWLRDFIYLFFFFIQEIVDNVGGKNDDVTHLNLWHRMVQLRDNYIILYEILYSDSTIHQMLINCK